MPRRTNTLEMAEFTVKIPRPLFLWLTAEVTRQKAQGLTSDRNAFFARLLAERQQAQAQEAQS